ncbi:MAG TPA: (2Fe-2S)-binding protein [Gammaproteobacteria bacterium]|nr:MAG: (2Fe-2S)-binding protein [OM182 bacterium]HAL41922.1 (2Fe-2S)-binding protein [Gammaproteobacteria bacterium]HBK17863.1 (2Fe-2S)-binding protein [Gammaproteobacteria bacterium]|tara:strand:- start:2233 stop:2724 length:492 start_codon:yes stop_codon:yes gene_type:complete
MPIKFKVNGRPVALDVPDDTPLLWAVRDELDMKGTKFGCGIGLCGACTVHVDGVAQRSCITPIASIAGSDITTIEGLAENNDHPLQQAWVATQTPQCGYCQSGQIMQAASLLAYNASPSDGDIESAMNGNLCRCMAYPRIKKAIKMAANQLAVNAAQGEVKRV